MSDSEIKADQLLHIFDPTKLDQIIDTQIVDRELCDKIKQQIHLVVDSEDFVAYEKIMEEHFNKVVLAQINERIATRYGVDVSEVTDEFLEEKKKKSLIKREQYIAGLEKTHGIKIKRNPS